MKPYGYVRKDGEGLFIYGEHQFQNTTDAELVPVYTHPLPSKWKNLTKTQINAIACRHILKVDGGQSFARAIEAKLKEKNT